MLDWTAILPNAIWAVVGGTLACTWTRFQKWHKNRGHRSIFSGLEGPTLFVFPPRPPTDSTTLPHMAIEDFLAINNIISAYLLVGKAPPSRMRDVERLTYQDMVQNNLILICSSKSNTVTGEALAKLRPRNSIYQSFLPCFEDVEQAQNELRIVCNDVQFLSKSYRQGGPALNDMAMIVKCPNPWAPQRKLLIVAGIRGIGTWGAAEFLKKGWKELYDKKDKSRSRGTSAGGDFAAIVSVHYENYDIVKVTLERVVDLDQHP
jgi:hypothetical protein